MTMLGQSKSACACSSPCWKHMLDETEPEHCFSGKLINHSVTSSFESLQQSYP